MVASVNKDMVEVRVIRPYRASKEVCCKNCNLTYSKPHYKVLFDNHKLVYFQITEPAKAKGKKGTVKEEIICHECFFHYLVSRSKIKKGGVFFIRFVDGKKDRIMEISADLSGLDLNDEDFD